ncbi:GNAT family N-acetyltransferase [Opitutia bacterium ISCC 51]|nr:GNAT family N-acetyltransferase [Opitutae bacterium ISCC 51]QXD30117.1 GNAT family N-acetyltransferase [Opitutae bacterium ISCC 52]
MNVAYQLNDSIESTAVIELYEANNWSSVEKSERLMKALRGSHSLVTARVDGMLVGLGNAISDGHLLVYYPHMVVHPDYHRQGIGSGIMIRMQDTDFTEFG